jgi:hypothetical protein
MEGAPTAGCLTPVALPAPAAGAAVPPLPTGHPMRFEKRQGDERREHY